MESVQEERDLGVFIRADLKSVSQCYKSAATARRHFVFFGLRMFVVCVLTIKVVFLVKWVEKSAGVAIN